MEGLRGSRVVEGVKKVNVTIPTIVNLGDTIHVPEGGKMQLKKTKGVQNGIFFYIKMQRNSKVWASNPRLSPK